MIDPIQLGAHLGGLQPGSGLQDLQNLRERQGLDDLDSLEKLNGQVSLGDIGSPEGSRKAAEFGLGATAASGESFGELVAGEIDKVNQAMNESDELIEGLATGKSSDVHGTMIAMQKADLSFKMLLAVRNKVLSAYEEVMRTQT